MPTDARLEKLTRAAAGRQTGLTVVLQDIQDPHNVMAICRSCDAFGIQQVYLIFENTPAFNPRRIGKASSSSANKWLDFSTYGSTAECVDALRAERYTLIATALDDRAESVFEATLPEERIALWVGNEHAGLTPEAVAAADRTLMIPMAGMVQSLNVSVATAICLYEVTRQRRAEGRIVALDAEAGARLVADFAGR
jgi:tRNA (guanosine-2'-O-)-methyltransferase